MNLNSHLPSNGLPPYLSESSDHVALTVKVQPRASRNEIGEPFGNSLKIKVAAPPVDSAANEALIRFLADVLGCARNQIELVRGQASRNKVIRISGLSGSAIATALNEAIG